MSTAIIFRYHKVMPDWLILGNTFPVGGSLSIIFQSSISKCLPSISKAVNTCEYNKRRQIVPVLKWYLGLFDIKP